MNKILKFLICSTFLGTNLNAENNFSNYVDNDHRIRNFSFMGPFPKNFNGDSLIIAETKNNRDFKEIEYKRKNTDGKIRTPQMAQMLSIICGIFFQKQKQETLSLQKLMLIPK